MPFAMGAQGTHDDSSHQGSAKRDVALGVAALDAVGQILATELPAVELTTNKDAASGYAGLDASSLLALAQQRTNFKIGSFTRDMTTADGDQAITGVGFQPILIILFASRSGTTGEFSIGLQISGTQLCQYNSHNITAGSFTATNAACLLMKEAAGSYQFANINTFGADGFTVTWTKTGTPAGTCTVYYLAIK